MRHAELLHVNSHVTIKVEEGAYRGAYPSLIQDVAGNTVTLLIPLVDRRTVPIRPGTRIEISLASRGMNYLFPGVVIERVLKPVPLLKVSLEEKARTLQRRNFVRVEAELPFYFRSVDDAASLKKPMETGTTRDISGSGALVAVPLTTRPLPGGTNLQIEIVLPARKRPVRGKARVIRMWTVKSPTRGIQNMAIEFTGLDEADREDIIKFVIARQKELRRKGLL